MKRREFPAKVKAAAFERAAGRCEDCTAKLHAGKFHYDHRIPDAQGGEPVLENCDVLCTACHGVKTVTRDVPIITKTRHQHIKAIGAKARSRNPLRNEKWKRKVSGQTVLR